MKRKQKANKMHNITLNIEVTETKWSNCLEDLNKLSEQIVATTIEYVKQFENIDFLSFNKQIVIGLSLSNDREIQTLNNEFRGKDNPTNVLSFANIDYENFYNDIKLFDEIELGDIIISYETMEKEAYEKNIPFINHYTHLLIHGTLHLLGFDHVDDDQADYMEDFEVKILKIFNIDNPYRE